MEVFCCCFDSFYHFINNRSKTNIKKANSTGGLQYQLKIIFLFGVVLKMFQTNAVA